jgi:monofunctional biosynthetic peptidoglycan transglycosylase
MPEMKNLLIRGLLLMTVAIPPATAADNKADEVLLTDFTPGSADFGWYVVNDNVMGGRSEGTFDRQEYTLHFAGRTNTSGGGFSSIRADSMRLDLSASSGIRLRIKGDGRRYTWRLATTARWRGRPVSYWADFDTVAGEWTSVDIPFSSFVPKFRGYRLDGPPLDTSQIAGMGLMIYDNRDGPFELYLDSVSAYAETTP